VVTFFYATKPAKILLNLLNSCIKRLLSDGFNMANAIEWRLWRVNSGQLRSVKAFLFYRSWTESYRFLEGARNIDIRNE